MSSYPYDTICSGIHLSPGYLLTIRACGDGEPHVKAFIFMIYNHSALEVRHADESLSAGHKLCKHPDGPQGNSRLLESGDAKGTC